MGMVTVGPTKEACQVVSCQFTGQLCHAVMVDLVANLGVWYTRKPDLVSMTYEIEKKVGIYESLIRPNSSQRFEIEQKKAEEHTLVLRQCEASSGIPAQHDREPYPCLKQPVNMR